MNVFLTIQPMADSAMAVLIWLVQLVIYPSFRSIDSGRFNEWHSQYMHTISWIVIPLMFVQAGCIGIQCVKTPSVYATISAVAILVAWSSTFALSVPCHRQLQAIGNSSALTARLLKTNWIRTVAWSIAWLAGLA